eukprot:Em0006g1189a
MSDIQARLKIRDDERATSLPRIAVPQFHPQLANQSNLSTAAAATLLNTILVANMLGRGGSPSPHNDSVRYPVGFKTATPSGYKKEWSGSGYKKGWSGSGYKKEWSGYKKEWSGSGASFWKLVLELVNMCLPQYSNKGIVVAADEFSEVLKGFVVEDLQLLMTASSRPLTMLWLNPAEQSTREQYYPILEELKKRYPKREPSFFAEYWKECFDLKTEDLLGLKCLRKYEQFYALIHLVPPDNQDRLGFLNPFLVIHKLIRKNYSEAEMDVFRKLESAFTTVPWDADAKGNALEMLVVSALQLRQIHTQSYSFSFSKVLSALCGPSHLSSLTITTKGVKFRSTLATGVKSFPCHDSSPVNKEEARPTGHGRHSFCDDEEMKEARRIAAIGAIKSHGIIHPTSVMNKGCDIILVLNSKRKAKDVL